MYSAHIPHSTVFCCVPSDVFWGFFLSRFYFPLLLAKRASHCAMLCDEEKLLALYKEEVLWCLLLESYKHLDSVERTRTVSNINFNFYVFQEMNRKVAAQLCSSIYRVTTVLIKFLPIFPSLFAVSVSCASYRWVSRA